MSVATTTDGALTLHLEDFTRVTGEKVQGWVELNVPLAREDHIEHVRIKCAILIYARVTVVTFVDTHTHRDSYNIFEKEIKLWDPNTDSESSNGILSLPFEFTLPNEAKMPGSFYFTGHDCLATVGYSIEVIGQRPREHILQIYRPNRRVFRALTVLPAATPKHIQTKELFAKGWGGEWKTHESEIKFGKGVARLKVTLPDTWSFPVATPIPFTLVMETDTHDGGEPVDKTGRYLFPHTPSAVQFYLHRWTHLMPEGRVRRPEDDIGLGVSAPSGELTTSLEWIPGVGIEDEEEEENEGFWHKLKFGHKHEHNETDKSPPAQGVWRRITKVFEATMCLPFTPTYSGNLLQWQYQLKFVVPSPGHHNLTLLVPLALIPIHPTPPSPAERPPQIFGLPPAYYDEVHDDVC